MTTKQHKQPRPGDFFLLGTATAGRGIPFGEGPLAIAIAFDLLAVASYTAPPPGDFVGTPPVQLAGGAPFGEEPLDIGAISVTCHVLGSGSWCFSLLIYDPVCSTSCLTATGFTDNSALHLLTGRIYPSLGPSA